MTRRTTIPAALAIAATLSILPAQAQEQKDYKINKEDVQAAELLVPRMALHPVKSNVINSPGDAIDTLDTINEHIKIILYNDNTWKYWKDPSLTIENEDFSRHWESEAPDAYGIAYGDLPQEWSIWLVDSTSQFCCPFVGNLHPRGKFGLRRGRRHQGIDLPLNTGTPIHAAFDGKVRVSKFMKGYGNVVIIRHTNGLETVYGHLSERKVQRNDFVSAGDIIGLGGSTGRSTGPHLHFETRHMGYAFDPQWVIDFQKGELRKQLFVLKKKYFSVYSNYTQDFEDEISNEEEDKKEEAERNAMQYYTVKSGDTLSRIAVKYHTTVGALCRLNGIKETTILQIGKRLRVR